jgi:hypothetical protein
MDAVTTFANQHLIRSKLELPRQANSFAPPFPETRHPYARDLMTSQPAPILAQCKLVFPAATDLIDLWAESDR